MVGRCDVIIPVKDPPHRLSLCLEELFRYATADEVEKILVVDHGAGEAVSPDIERICARYPAVRLLKCNGHASLSGARNLGAKNATAAYFLFLQTDCLITPGAIRKLISACGSDSSIGMACPLSNNFQSLSLPMLPGRSYIEMNALLEHATVKAPSNNVVLDSCISDGSCLIVTRGCWQKTGEFSELENGDSSQAADFQMRALENGFRGVAVINTYVLKSGLHKIEAGPSTDFEEKWGAKYRTLTAKQKSRDPVALATKHLSALPAAKLTPCVLFVLPGLAQGVGGIHVVVDLCNFLIRSGLDAKCAVLGRLDEKSLQGFQEPIFFGFLHFPYEQVFVGQKDVAPKSVVATLFSTVPGCFAYTTLNKIPLLYFVQGYECLFENGTVYNQAADTYVLADHLIVTSDWLKTKIQQHAVEQPLSVLPIGIDLDLFRPSKDASSAKKKVRVGLVLREAQDKGQWILLDVLDALAAHKDVLELIVLATQKYDIPRKWNAQEFTRVNLPLDRTAMATHLGAFDIFLDASLHEGFGLIPLEAMACGAVPVVSDSGGVNQYLRSGENGILISEINRPDKYVDAILSLAKNRMLLSSLRTAALTTAAGYSADVRYREYEKLIRTVIGVTREVDVRSQAVVHTFFQRGPEKEAQLTELVEKKQMKIDELTENHAKITNGVSYRFGRLLTAPFRLLFKKF